MVSERAEERDEEDTQVERAYFRGHENGFETLVKKGKTLRVGCHEDESFTTFVWSCESH